MNSQNQRSFSNYTVLESHQATATGSISKKFMAGVFAWMFVALGVSAGIALLFANNPSFTSLLYNQTPKGVSLNGMGMAISFAPLVFVLVMSFAFTRLSASLLTLFFLLFAITMGMSLSTILFVYTAGSVIGCFATASVMFGVMAVLGYTTDKDLTSFGSLLTMGLVGLVIASMVNWFIHSPMLDYMISIIGVAVFTGLTAYDVQKLKRIGAGIEFGGAVSANDTKKAALMGALNLYLDFINLFIMLLRLFGNRRD
ncbi:MAG: Bax inhibitor-1/YccA family protein [Bacteroidota bacterium]